MLNQSRVDKPVWVAGVKCLNAKPEVVQAPTIRV